MRILFCGDVVGSAGRACVIENLPRLRRELALDFIIVNGENAAAGFGITDKICAELYAVGVDVITTGNHVWDRREIIPYIAGDPHLLRPANFPAGTPGSGSIAVALADGRRALVVNVMARLFMDALDDPFAAVDAALAAHPLGTVAGTVHAVIIDFHGEAAAQQADEEFRRVFSDRKAPSDIEEKSLPASSEPQFLTKIIVAAGLAPTNKEAQRLVAQGGVLVDEARVDDPKKTIDSRKGKSYLLKVGKRRFARVTFV